MHGSCPECDADIEIEEGYDIGDRLRCHVCRAYLVIIGTHPIELDWVYVEDQLKLGDQEYGT